jgi:hypothetical protein
MGLIIFSIIVGIALITVFLIFVARRKKTIEKFPEKHKVEKKENL